MYINKRYNNYMRWLAAAKRCPHPKHHETSHHDM